jgi:NAD(P)-dependent dehydrogenase (short-subunit alcohol dehydrogenase family)
MFGVEGKRAVVTASGGKMGGAIALRLAEAGASIVLNDRVPGLTAPYADQIRAMGRAVLEVEGDVTERASAEAVVGAAIDTWGGVDILVNNVGGMKGPYTDELADITEDSWDTTMRINLRGTFLCSQLAVPGMIERRSGKIVNIASTAWAGGVSPYSVSKAGVVSFTRGLANELAKHNINVNAVAPGATQTRVRYGDEILPRIPLRRVNDPEDVANTVLFLASDEARQISGQLVIVAGGSNPSL